MKKTLKNITNQINKRRQRVIENDKGNIIANLYQELEIELVKSMKRNLSRHLKEEEKVGFEFSQWQALALRDLKSIMKQNENIIKAKVKKVPKEVKEILNEEYRQGRKEALKEYKDIVGKSSINVKDSFFNLSNRRVKAIIDEVTLKLDKGNKAIYRMVNDTYRSVIYKSSFFYEHNGMSLQQAIDKSIKDFISRGLNVIEYKDGRRVNIANYSKMAIRTASKRVMLHGEGDFRKSIGRTLVKISKHNTSCPLCKKWEGKILIDDIFSGGSRLDGKYPLLSEAMGEHLYHPNCRHRLYTYYPELEGIIYENTPEKTEENSISSKEQRKRREETYKEKTIE